MTNYEASTKRLPPAMCTYLFRDKMISYELYWWLLLLHLYRVAAVNAWLRDGTASLERGRGVRAYAHMYICVQIISNLHFYYGQFKQGDSRERSKHYIDLFSRLDDSSIATNLQSNLAIRNKLAQSCSSNLHIRLEISLVSKEE